MKTQSAWGNSAKFIGGTALICSVLLLTVLECVGKRVLPDKRRSTKEEASGLAKPRAAKEAPRWVETYASLPLNFEENRGQTAREVRYVSHGSGYELFLTPQEAVLALSDPVRLDLSPRHRFATLLALRKAREASQTKQLTAVRLRFEGANPEPQMVGTGEMPGKVNYFIGNDPKKWHTDVPTYARVNYTGIYPGIDLVFYGKRRHLEYDFVVAPGADPKAIRLSVDGARKLCVNANGDLALAVRGHKIEFQRPVVYQQVNGKRHEIAGWYAVVGDHRVGFAVGEYDRSKPLILDPVLNFSTYLGGSSDDDGSAIAVDANGNAVVAGTTSSTDFPSPATVNGFQKQPLAANTGTHTAAFVSEIDPTGTQLKYSTYLAGSAPAGIAPGEGAFGVDVDSAGKIYVTGFTSSTDFPTNSVTAGFKPTSPANGAAGTSFITKLDPTATGASSLLYSSYIGGTNGTGTGGVGDFGQAIAADQKQNGVVYVTGFTESSPGASVSDPTGFPVVGGFQTTLGSPNGNAFLAKIDTTVAGTASLKYSTYLGGNDANFVAANAVADIGDGVATDSAGGAYIGGITYSTNLATTANATQPTYPASNTTNTAFVARIDTTQTGSSSLLYLSYLGGASPDFIDAVALGGTAPNVLYVTGETHSVNFPTTTGAFSTTKGSPATVAVAFVTLVNTKAAVSAPPALPVYSTFVGGTGGDDGAGIKVDSQGNAYVGGITSSTNFPLVAGAFQPAMAPGAFGNGFVFKLSPSGNGTKDLLYSTYFGGSGDGLNQDRDRVEAIAIDASNNAYITGHTFSTPPSFPVFPATAFQTTRNGPGDAFVAKLTLIPTLVVAPTLLDFGNVQIGTTSAAKTVTLTNNTNATITFTSAAVTGGSPAAANTDYAVSANTCTGGIPAGTSPANQCTISVTFKPSIVGAETATLKLTDGDSTSPQNIALSGTGSNTPDFTLMASPNTLTVARGAVGAPVTITVNPVNGFASAVALNCTGAPVNSSCVLNPTSITPPTTSTMTFTAHAMLVPLPISKPALPLNLLRLVPLLVALMLVFLLLSKQRLRTRLAMASAILICITLAACSSGGPNKPAAGTYPLTITGTSGGLSHSTTVTVTVN